MQYVTTRNSRDTYPALCALRENRCPDGGFYLPDQASIFSAEEISALQEKSFGQAAAEVLNRLFGTALTSWDIDFSIGRYPVRLKPMGHRVLVAETWHNPDWNYDRLVSRLLPLLSEEQTAAGDWVKIAVRIAVLFGIYGEINRMGIGRADISLVSGDFSGPMSAWYARWWGLPIGNIVCCCNDNSGLWDLICHGRLRTDGICAASSVPEADIALPVDLERLVYVCGGTEEVERYLDACRKGTAYCPEERMLEKMRAGLFVGVVSSQRLDRAIPSVYGTHRYVMAPGTALSYCGLQDYRAKTGQTGYAVILADRHPICDSGFTAERLGISEQALRELL